MKKGMREAMPMVAKWIDDLRAAFGDEQINGAIRLGLKGRPYFWAREGEYELGTRWPAIGADDEHQASKPRS